MKRLDVILRRRILVIIAASVLVYCLGTIVHRLWMQKSNAELSESTRERVQQHRESPLLDQAAFGPLHSATGNGKAKQTETLPEDERTYPFDELLLSNPDTVGWIRIPDTRIDYPIVRGTNNAYYLTHSFDRKKNRAGSIFMDYRNTDGKEERNTVLYGHHMRDGTMFNQLSKYTDEEFFKSHRVITFDSSERNQDWEVFSVYVSDTEFDYIRTEFDDYAFDTFLDEIQSKSSYRTDVILDGTDRILTLSTCDYTFGNARLVVHARLLKAGKGI